MRYLIILCLAGLLAGCGVLGPFADPAMRYHYVPQPSMDYALAEENGWRILLPDELRRMDKKNLSYWKKYFPLQDARSLSFWLARRHNYFLVSYGLPGNNEIALWISIIGALPTTTAQKTILLDAHVENEVYYDEQCVKTAHRGITIAFNALDADFESDSLYLLVGERKIQGEHIPDTHKDLNETTIYAPARYNLGSPETISKMQPALTAYGFSPTLKFNYPVFKYRFPVVCTDLENAVLVVDGLYYRGNRLPPLKIRTRYVDFSKVLPVLRYEGAAAGKER